MKLLKRLIIFVVLAMSVSFISCHHKVENAETVDIDSLSVDTAVVNNTYFMAIEDYLTRVIGSQYSQGDVCIPYIYFVDVDERNDDDILVWGDFWVYNYQVVGDMLKTVSGGNHAGLMHVRQTDNTFEVIGFDAVADGSGYLESAKKIFGDKYKRFHEVSSDLSKREIQRKEITKAFVKKHHLDVTRYKDEGWPAVKL